MTTSPSDTYRPDIDGLRAIAVILVILYHAKIPPFTGGYIGVDVFFVITGFLITSLLTSEIESNTFSYKSFYSRRILRLFPALFVVVLATSVAALYLLIPNDFSLFADAVQAISVFGSNILFYFTQDNYWTQTLVSKQPLLHTWSLAIEEQFYILFPLILVVANKLKKTWLPLLILALLSLRYSANQVGESPASAFYLLPSRMFEILIGALLVTVAKKKTLLKPVHLNLLSLAGLFAILFSAYQFTSSTPFPGGNGLIPCFGTALIIFSGSNENATLVNRILSTKPLVFVGLISYSLYLWHWPIIVYSNSPYWALARTSTPALWTQISLTFVLAAISWRFVEVPFRKRSSRFKPNVVIASGLIIVAAIYGLAVFLQGISENKSPFEQPIHKLLTAQEPKQDDPFRFWQGSDSPEQIMKDGGGRALGVLSKKPDFILVGDSFASMWGYGLNRLAHKKHSSGLMMARESCALIGEGVFQKKPIACKLINDARLKFIKQSSAKKIVVAASWLSVFRTASEHGSDLQKFTSAIEDTLTQLSNTGKQVYIVLPLPNDQLNYQVNAVMSMNSEAKAAYQDSVVEAGSQKEFNEITDMLKALTKKIRLVPLDPVKRICGTNGCLSAKDGNSIYLDGIHLSDYGADQLADIFDPLFD